MTMWDAFGRAIATCMHPRVMLWSMLPLALVCAAVGLLGLAYWEFALDAVRATLDAWSLGNMVLHWLQSVDASGLRALVAPIVVVALAVPVVMLVTLLLVAALAAPAVVRMVAARRFPHLHEARGASGLQRVLWSLACTAAALLALVLSIPLWLVPPLVMVLPPLIWGWLIDHVLGFDVLARHASAAERRLVLRGRRWSLLAMGILCGYLASLPSLIWAVSSTAVLLAPLLGLVAVWMYTVVFVFSASWFAHFCLAELDRLRRATGASTAAPTERVEAAGSTESTPGATP